MIKCYISKKDGFYKNYEEWEKAYLPWLRNMVSQYGPYNDPDIDGTEYYIALTIFLNNWEVKFFKEEQQLVYSPCSNPFGICAKGKYDKSVRFYLKSDQLGFSAPQRNGNHPYDWFLKNYNGKDDKEKLVCKWVYYTRTIGGGFLWPLEGNENDGWNTNPYINISRGILKRQQDRVDLTLNLIKQFYLNGIDAKYFSKDRNLYKWLSRFGKKEEGWKRYVDYFKFNAFFINDDLNSSSLKLSKLKKNVFLSDEPWKTETYLDDLCDKIQERSRRMD